MKLFYSEMFFGLDLGGITSYGQKHFHETIIVCARKARRKQQINKKIIYEKLYFLLCYLFSTQTICTKMTLHCTV